MRRKVVKSKRVPDAKPTATKTWVPGYRKDDGTYVKGHYRKKVREDRTAEKTTAKSLSDIDAEIMRQIKLARRK